MGGSSITSGSSLPVTSWASVVSFLLSFPDPSKTLYPQGVGCRKSELGSQIKVGIGMSE